MLSNISNISQFNCLLKGFCDRALCTNLPVLDIPWHGNQSETSVSIVTVGIIAYNSVVCHWTSHANHIDFNVSLAGVEPWVFYVAPLKMLWCLDLISGSYPKADIKFNSKLFQKLRTRDGLNGLKECITIISGIYRVNSIILTTNLSLRLVLRTPQTLRIITLILIKYTTKQYHQVYNQNCSDCNQTTLKCKIKFNNYWL